MQQHIIEFWYVSLGAGYFAYDIKPKNPNGPKFAKVKRRAQVRWTCAQGKWKVTFKGETPLLDKNDQPITEVTGEAGARCGGFIRPDAPACKEYPYSVEVELRNGGGTKHEDPEIVIDEFPDISKRRKVGSTRNKPGAKRPKNKKRNKKK